MYSRVVCQWLPHNRVWMLYRIRNGLVAIPPDHLKQTTVATRRHEIHANSMQLCTYSQTFFPSAVRLWNRIPSDTCYLAPDRFKLEGSCRRLTSSDHAPSFWARCDSIEPNSYGNLAGWVGGCLSHPVLYQNGQYLKTFSTS